MVIAGRVHRAGKVVEHDHGYRAELARVQEILPIERQRARTEPVARRFGVPIGEEIPASSIARDPVNRSGSRTTRADRAPAPWLLYLLCANLAIRAMTSAAESLQLSDWWFGGIVLVVALGFAVWLFARRHWGRRFSAQLQAFGTAPRKHKL
jgi:hypothetical protein